MLVEVHMLQNHAPSNLNRDDTGSPKSCVFGGIRRARISSQCIKRSIRNSIYFKELFVKHGLSYRTRKLPALVYERLIEEGIDQQKAQTIVEKIERLGKSPKKSKKEKESDESKSKEPKPSKSITSQIMFFSDKELQSIIETIVKSIQSGKDVTSEKIWKKLDKKQLQIITPDIALFGRMVTSDVFLDIDASVQVAHALSTNKLEHEFDYFTAVDDLIDPKSLGQQGAGMIGDIEFNSSCYYKYFSLETDEFLKNIAGASKINNAHKITLTQTVNAFINATIFTTPTGKQNSFAAHQLPDAILIEIRDRKTPISYANAFLKPCTPSLKADLMDVSLAQFKTHVEQVNMKFNLQAKKRLYFTTRAIAIENTEECKTLNSLIEALSKELS